MDRDYRDREFPKILIDPDLDFASIRLQDDVEQKSYLKEGILFAENAEGQVIEIQTLNLSALRPSSSRLGGDGVGLYRRREVRATRGVADMLAMTKGPRPVDLGGAREILGHGVRMEVFNCEFVQQFWFQLELPEVVSEEQHTLRSQALHGQPNEFQMIPLHGKIMGPLGVGKGGRIKENQLIIAASSFQPFKTVGALQTMFVAVETIEREVTVGPFQKARGEVHGRRCGRSAFGRRDRGRSGVAEEVEKALALRSFPKPLAGEAVIEKQSRVNRVREIDEKAQIAFPDFQKLTILSLRSVPETPPLPCPHLEDHP